MPAPPAPTPPYLASLTDPGSLPQDGEEYASHGHERDTNHESDEVPSEEANDDGCEDSDDIHAPAADDGQEMPELPLLDQETVDEDDQLVLAIDEIITTDAAARAAQDQLADRQARLQTQLTPCQWAEVLGLEETMTARWLDLTLVLVKWAWSGGRRWEREG